MYSSYIHGVCDDDDDDDGDDDVLVKHGAMLCGYISGIELLAVTLHLYGYSHVTPYPQAQQATENLDAQSHRSITDVLCIEIRGGHQYP